MLRAKSWKIAIALLSIFILELFVFDVLLGVPNTKMSSAAYLELLLIPMAIFGAATLLSFAVAVFWISNRSFWDQMNYLIPRLASIALVFFILLFAAIRYYYATQKLGLTV